MERYIRLVPRAILFILGIAVIILLFPKEGKFKYEFSQGKPWQHDDLIAPFDFAIQKSDAEIEKERDEIRSSQLLYLKFNESIKKAQSDKFKSLYELDGNAIQRLLGRNGKTTREKKLGLSLLDSIYSNGLIDMTDIPEEMHKSKDVMIVIGKEAHPKPFSKIYKTNEINQSIKDILSSNPSIDSLNFTLNINKCIKPNLVYDSSLTMTDLRQRLAAIPEVRGMLQKDERVISKGELVDEESFLILSSLKQEYEEKLGGQYRYYGILGGQIILVTLAMFMLALFLVFFRPDDWESFRKNLLIILLIVFMASITALTIRLDVNWLYVVPLCLAPIIIRVFFDTSMAVFVHVITVMIIGFLVPNSFEYVFFQLTTGIVTIVSVKDLQKRGQFFMTSLWIFTTYAILMAGMTLVQTGSLKTINLMSMAMFGGSAMFTLFSYPLIYIVERAFGMVTDISLLEYADTNSKLLRQLSTEAPGTFQHSIQVANLAEEATREIGGNTLLVRAGALYHDIGKMNKPVYFTENQSGGINPHDKHSYKESVEILRDHVLKGVEMARKHNLPRQIVDFIKTHHGTKKAEYFYLKQKQDHPDQAINDKDFEYPGPEPQSKETAVVMMADALEAAARSLKDPNQESIGKLVDGIIDKQLSDNQFNYSDITLAEITRVKEVFKQKLLNVHHVRIAYPDDE